jgi:superfamily I DNA and/or RNA helicase
VAATSARSSACDLAQRLCATSGVDGLWDDTPMIDNRFVLVGGRISMGMAEVWKAYDTSGEFGEVAVKLLPSGTDDFHRRAFDRERRALELLRHPNVVPMLFGGVDAIRGQPFLVLPWLERRLQDEMFAAGGIGWHEWWGTLGEPLLSALKAAHKLKIHHRDLKPANIMLHADGHPMVIDFGISKIHGLMVPEATVDGASSPFTPPEPVSDSPGMTRDIHAWAALAVFALSGVDPYPPGPHDPWERLEQARHGAMPKLPAPVRSIVDRCLASDPKARPLDAELLAAELDLALERVRRDVQQDADRLVPIVPVLARDGVSAALEADLDLFAADIDDLIARELRGPVHVCATPAQGRYLLVTASLSIKVALHPDGHALVATAAGCPPSTVLDRDRERGWPCGLRLRVGEPQDRDDASMAVRELVQRAAEHQLAARSGRGLRRARPFAVWRGLLAMLRAYEAATEDPIGYSLSRVGGGTVEVEVDRPRHSIVVGDTRIAPSDDGREFVGVVTQARRDSITLEAQQGGPRSPRSEGTLRVDCRAAQTSIDRQFKALDAIEYGRSVRPDLAGLLADPASVSAPRPADDCSFRLDLDAAKRAAVNAALGSDDVLLVQGPPGTGKTTFITELVLQELDRNPDCRILLASQSNAALDHALRGIASQGEAIEMVRIARDEAKVAKASGELLLAKRIAAWRADAVRSGEAWLKRWADRAGIDAKAVEASGRLQSLAADLRRLQRLDQRRQVVDEEIKNLRARQRDSAQGSTSAQTLRERSEALSDLREERAVCADEVKEHVTRLAELGQLKRRTAISSLSADELELSAIDLLPDDERAAVGCAQVISLLSDWHAGFGAGPAFSAAALARAQVVAATCVGFAGQRGAERVEFDLVIVDEASKATAPELLIPLARGRRIVLVGDEHQLPPYIEDDALDESQLEERGLTAKEVKEPLFAALARSLPPANRVTLTHQHRMHPAIGELVSRCFYDGRLTSSDREPLSWLSVLAEKPVTWLTTTRSVNRHEQHGDGSSFRNDLEVQVISTLLNTMNSLAAAARSSASVAILTGYAAQRDALTKRLARSEPSWRNLTIECQTVDAFQGQQADIVVYSLTRSNNHRKLGFVKERPRVNVAVSRARDQLIIVGDHAFAREAHGAEALKKVLTHIENFPEDCVIEEARFS